jgi:hypothetical protein
MSGTVQKSIYSRYSILNKKKTNCPDVHPGGWLMTVEEARL